MCVVMILTDKMCWCQNIGYHTWTSAVYSWLNLERWSFGSLRIDLSQLETMAGAVVHGVTFVLVHATSVTWSMPPAAVCLNPFVHLFSAQTSAAATMSLATEKQREENTGPVNSLVNIETWWNIDEIVLMDVTFTNKEHVTLVFDL